MPFEAYASGVVMPAGAPAGADLGTRAGLPEARGMMEAPTTPLALAWVAQALRRRGARKCVRPVSGGAIAGEAALATTGGEIAAEIAADDIWLQEWRERIHRWW